MNTHSIRQLLLILTLALVGLAAHAQETVSGIRGVVRDAGGQALPGVTVTVSNAAIGLNKTTRTNAAGEYNFANLAIGSGYVLMAGGGEYGARKMEGLSLSLGKTANVDFTLPPGDALEEIIVSAVQMPTEQIAIGPSATFGEEILESQPAVNRDISDILRIDPRIHIDKTRGAGVNSVECAGKNSRFNSLTVDGVRMSDAFGLNLNRYPTERMPFSYDAIRQLAVEFAPFDVEYGSFSACNINAVTKSGSNEFRGSAFFDYTDSSLRADSLENEPVRTGKYSEKRYGATFGGPAIEDKLFFFLAYEKLEGADLFDQGPVGSGAIDEVPITQAELDEIADIARTIYQYDPGVIPTSEDNADEKLLLKMDWNITDDHRLAFTYNYNDGFSIRGSDGGQTRIQFSNHLYERGATLHSWVGSLFSDWTDDFSTEVRIGYLELDSRNNALGGSEFGEMRIQRERTGDLPRVDVFLGADDNRHANRLSYDTLSLAFKGKYYWNGHNLTLGYERETVDIFNLFIAHAQTEIRFSGIDNFRQGLPRQIEYNNARTNSPEDAAADWAFNLNTVYLQDEFAPLDRLIITAGLRYDWYTTNDIPPENADFVEDYGFSNTATLDGEDLLQPRLGFAFDYSEDTQFHGGVGLYSGGNPNVWLSNTYSANNVLQFGLRRFSSRSRPLPTLLGGAAYAGCEAGVPEGPGYCIPQRLFDEIAAGRGRGSDFDISYLDPDFKIPSEWKFALGLTHAFPQEYLFSANFLYTLTKDSAIIQHGHLEQTGTNPEGYPLYGNRRCGASRCVSTLVLTNSDQTARSLGFSVGLSKRYDNGIDFTLGYSWSDSEDINPMTASVAGSNYRNRAFFDPQEDVASTSNYNTEHRISGTVSYYRRVFDGLVGLRMGLYGSANSGRPFSTTVETRPIWGGTPFLNRGGALRPGVERNSENGPWWGEVDLRISADFRGFTPGSRATAFMVIDNFTNLLNDDWGVLKAHSFAQVLEEDEFSRFGNASRYEIRFGVKYSF